MKKTQIRQGVFETNSSSTHSISIAPGLTGQNGLMDTSLIPDYDGNIVLEGDEFGWDVAKYNDAVTKANYVAVYVEEWSGSRSEEFKEIFAKVMKEQTGCKELIISLGRYAYIDHQSVESQDLDYLFEDPEQLRSFIFNPDSVLTTDNDNRYRDDD